METEVSGNTHETHEAHQAEFETHEVKKRTNVRSEGKTIAIISYLTVIGLIIAFLMNNEKKNPFAHYHIRQSLGLTLTGVAISFLNIIPILGLIINVIAYFVLLYMLIMGILNAINERKQPLPILGKKYDEWLKSI